MIRWPGQRGSSRVLVNVAVTAVLIAVAVLGYYVSYRQETIATEARQAQRLAHAAQQVKYRAADLNGWQTLYAFDIDRGVARADDDNATNRARFLAAVTRFDADLTALASLSAPPEVGTALGAARSAFDEFVTLDQRIVALYRTGRSVDRRAAADLVAGREIELYDRIARGCDVAVARSAADADAAFAHLDSVGVATRRYLMTLSALAIVLAVLGMVLARARQRAAAERARQVQRMASLGQLAGGIAHDFNNILSIILNYTAFVAEHAQGGARDDLTHIRTAAERAVGLTTQLLGFIRQDTVHREILDVNAAVAETQALLARTIGEHIELIAVPSPSPLLISADAGQVQQILVNLAVNARDAMPDGGTLVLAATTTDIEENQVDLRPPVKAGRYVQILVSDTGTGIPPDVVAHIFEPFYTTKPKGRGTGLGLATVHNIITTAGGSIDVCSKPGIGTTFRVYFPAVDPPDDTGPASPSATRAPRGHGQSVLIVEDEPVLAACIARILATAGYRPRSVVSGPEAITAYTDDGCELLIADVVMPEMSGPRLAEIIHRTQPCLPVVFVSGYADGTLDPARLIPPEAILIEKPFSANQLLSAVGAALGEAGVPAGRATDAQD